MKLNKTFALAFIAMLVLAACGAPKKEAVQEDDTNHAQEESGIEVDKGLMNVEVTLPSSFFDEDELDSIEEKMKEEANADVTQNDDGSITMKMSKSDHKKMLAEVKEEFDKSITQIIESEDFASIHDVEYNKDLSKIKLIVDKDTFENSLDSFATLTVGISSMFYQALNGKDISKDKVMIEIIDQASKEVFSEVIYPDVLDEMMEEE